MLQPIPARPVFRLLEAALAIGLFAGGGVLAYSAAAIVRAWTVLSVVFMLLGISVVTIGGLALIHAATGCFPEWVVGTAEAPPNDEPPAV